MRIWFNYNGQGFIAAGLGPAVLPVQDLNGGIHIVRWGADQSDDPRLLRGKWNNFNHFFKSNATWVPIPITKYEERARYSGHLLVCPTEPLAGALIRLPGVRPVVYLVVSDIPGDTAVVPCGISEIRRKQHQASS